MYAIIKTGGKQYRVQKDDVFKIEKINAEAGDTVTFDEVIAVGGDTLTVGTPFVEGTAVHAEVVEQGKNDKVIIYKYKARRITERRMATDSHTHWLRLPISYPVVRRQLQLRSRTM